MFTEKPSQYCTNKTASYPCGNCWYHETNLWGFQAWWTRGMLRNDIQCFTAKFVSTITQFWRLFPLKFFGKLRKEKETNKFYNHHVISMVCTLIQCSSRPISAWEIAQLLLKKVWPLQLMVWLVWISGASPLATLHRENGSHGGRSIST